jgi:hypothetical protein
LEEFLNARNPLQGCAALHYAAQRDPDMPPKHFSKLLEALLTAGANVNEEVSAGAVLGATALYLAAAGGDAESIGTLLAYGADPDITLAAAAGGYSPLAAAVDRGHVEAVRALVSREPGGKRITQGQGQGQGQGGLAPAVADPNLGGGKGWSQSPLLLAVIKGHSAIVGTLLDAGADCTLQIAVGKKSDPPGAAPAPESLAALAGRRRDFDVLQVLGSHAACQGDLRLQEHGDKGEEL